MQESLGCAENAVELVVPVGNKELIVAGLYYWQENGLAGFFLVQGIPPKVLLYCLCVHLVWILWWTEDM